MRIAIVGAGVSGLVVAHLLHHRHEVTVFEAAPYAGGHTNTIRVDTPSAIGRYGVTWALACMVVWEVRPFPGENAG